MEFSKMNDPKKPGNPSDSIEELESKFTTSYIPRHELIIADPDALVLFNLGKLRDYYIFCDEKMDSGNQPTLNEFLYSLGE